MGFCYNECELLNLKMEMEELNKTLQAVTENGQHLSPILPEGVKNYLIDIDGTVCDDIPNEEPERMLTAVSGNCENRSSANAE